MNVDNLCILITGCISPNANVPTLVVSDRIERRRQYIECISFFISNSIATKIVYCDNSDEKPEKELYCLAEKEKKIFEWLSFKGDTDSVIKYGKGFGEGEIVKYAINNSKIIESCTQILKITGKLKILNINSIIKYLSDNSNYFEYHKDYIDTRCYIVAIESYKKYLLDAYYSVNDRCGNYLEHVFWEIAKGYPDIFQPVPINFRFEGQSGSVGIYFHDSVVIHTLKCFKRLGLYFLHKYGRKLV